MRDEETLWAMPKFFMNRDDFYCGETLRWLILSLRYLRHQSGDLKRLFSRPVQPKAV